MNPGEQIYEMTTLAGGCFWCLEAIFDQLNGVIHVESGYAGGTVPNPTYEQVCSGKTGHAEVVQITFDPNIITYQEILDIFFNIHDPTTLNRQGADVGTQYRSAIFYHSETQKDIAKGLIETLDQAGRWPTRIVTEVIPFTVFYEAEMYHQEYYQHHLEQPYCQLVVAPKVDKFQQYFETKLK
ncbi:MAG: peptide-methionine (S)-S-oxide reductase MsrA [Anaerolineae bacterium]|nr:peptide-methionine (S)-S-oxide reductase MsrA [Anaerolineae bacterium]